MNNPIEAVSELLELIIEDDKMIPNLAKLMKKMYDELLKVGFTEDQAGRIVSNFKATGN